MPVPLIAECEANCRLCCNAGFLPPLNVYTKASIYVFTFIQSEKHHSKKKYENKTQCGPLKVRVGGDNDELLFCYFF